MKPHKVKQWLTPSCSHQELVAGSARICEVYKEAPDLQKENIFTICSDEKTGMQALERNEADLQTCVGKVALQEVEYTRHGTQCLIGNWDVVAGKCIAPTVCDTRTEVDFQVHIKQTVEAHPDAKQIRFIVDNLNTHLSEALVRYVASQESAKENGNQIDLGQKGKYGILKNKQTRADYLSDSTHKIYFIYTPKHCSWLNQIEIYFGILHKKVIKRGNFVSKEDLKEKVLKFIQYFNETVAKPFQWTYGGKPCKA